MKVALIQLNAGDDKKRNLDRALRLTLEAIRRKAEFILLPEVFNYRGKSHLKKGYKPVAEYIPGPSTIPFMIFAKAHRVFILAGSIYERVKRQSKVYNTSVLINDKGKIIAKYRKIHLFKAALSKKNIDESKCLLAGKALKIEWVKDFKVGLSICYDLRFPELFRRYQKAGVDVICIPSSFTKTTGQAHWEVLLRARAIENLCYILAPNQFGKTPNGVETYGNSLIVDPWGKILARAPLNKTEILYAAIDIERLKGARRRLPAAFNFR